MWAHLWGPRAVGAEGGGLAWFLPGPTCLSHQRLLLLLGGGHRTGLGRGLEQACGWGPLRLDCEVMGASTQHSALSTQGARCCLWVLSDSPFPIEGERS